jgi:CRISPR type IV-associated protein Csf1
MEKGRITAVINGPVIMPALARLNSIDGILAFVVCEKMKAENPEHTMEDIQNCIGSLPLKKVPCPGGFYYACSVPEIAGEMPLMLFSFGMKKGGGGEEELMTHQTIFKSNSYMNLSEHWGPEATILAVRKLKGFNGGGGPFKQAILKRESFHVQSISWIVEGDIEQLREIISRIDYIGKKPPFGCVQSIDITPVPADTPIQRLIPVDMAGDGAEGPQFPAQIKPPYWERNNKQWVSMGIHGTKVTAAKLKTPATMYPTEFFYNSYYRGSAPPYEHPRTPDVSNGRPCAICGRVDQVEGYKTYTKGTKYGLISADFGEHYMFPAPWSGFSCKFCESVIRSDIVSWSGALITESKTVPVLGKDKAVITPGAMVRADVMDMLLDPPKEPFLLGINKNLTGKNGTHFISQGVINLNRDRYFVNEGDQVYLIDREFLTEFYRRTMLIEESGAKASINNLRYYFVRQLKGFTPEWDEAKMVTIAPYLEGDFHKSFLDSNKFYAASLFMKSYFSALKTAGKEDE